MSIGAEPGELSKLSTQVLDLLPDAVLTLDFDYRITYANAVARKLSRIQPEHINGPTHWELYPATLGTITEKVYRQVMTERVARDFEVYYAPFEVWLSLNVFPVESGIAVLYRDITRVKRVETAKLASDLRLEQVLEVTTDGVVMLDRDYTFVFMNRRAKELLAARGDVMGRNLWEMFPVALDEDLPYLSTYRGAMEGVPGRFESFYPEPLNMWLRVEAYPAEQGVTLFFRDVTDERVNAEQLRQRAMEVGRQAAEIETMYQTAPIGLALFDPVEFRYLRLNARQAEFFTLPAEEILGKTVTEMAPIPGLQEMFEHVRDGGHIVNQPLEGELVNRPGEYRYWTVNYSPVIGSDGKVQAISAASLEITQQKKAEGALMQSEKLAAVGRLAASISHEINNPLESVINLVYLIGTSENLPADVREYVSTAERELARVSQIVTQTLRFHRQTTRPMPVTAEQLLDGATDLFGTRLVNGGVKVETRILSRGTVLVLENEIRQVLNNLIGNAIDAMPDGGTLYVRSKDYRDESGRQGVLITVADTGTGMSRETTARIYEPFFTTKEMNGTGLGLWISAEIVRRHSGSLHVRSSQRAGSHGTVFQLFLPRESDVQTQQQAVQ